VKVLRRCIGSYAGMRCAGHVEVVLVSVVWSAITVAAEWETDEGARE